MDNRTMRLKRDKAERFEAAMQSLELNTADYDIFDLLEQPERILGRLIERFRHSNVMVDARTLDQPRATPTMQTAVEMLWNSAQHTRATKNNLLLHQQERLHEIELFCTRAAYKLGIPARYDYRKQTQRNANKLVAIVMELAWPLWRLDPRL